MQQDKDKPSIKVSIITVCYNSCATIKATIESVLNQTYNNLEYIIIDGGSTDGTLKIIEEYKKITNISVILISETDAGIYDAMNKGINLCSGELIGIVNSDDWLENNAVEKIVAGYKNNNYEIIYGMVRIIEKEKEKAVTIKHHQFLEREMIYHPACFVTKATYNDYGCFDLRFKSSADYDFMLRMFDNDKIKFTPVYSIISNFRMGGMSSTQIGYRETLAIRLERCMISKKEYWYRLIKSYLYDFIKK